MAIRPIITAPDPLLKQVSAPVKAVTDETRALMDDMLETMYDAPGIGLAAIQVGVPQRILVIDLQQPSNGEGDGDGDGDGGIDGIIDERDDAEPVRNPQYFINPEIIKSSDDVATYQEGCLSVPEFFEDVDRPATCTVKYLDYDGNEQVQDMDGLMATCIQHEMDHLNGILFVDHLSRLKRNMILKKLKKQKALNAA
ncbi:MAG: peptide deformylase [Alphaproteobacteria bacterium]